MPITAMRLDTEERPFVLDASRLEAVSAAAVEAGEMSRDQATRLCGGSVGVAAMNVSSIALAPWSMLVLGQVGVLEAIARAVPTYLIADDREHLAKDLDRAERAIQLKKHLTALRELVADRLANGKWTTLPRISVDKQTGGSLALAPHLESLAESVESMKSSSDFVWIEDRPLSLSRLPTLVNIGDVAAYLHKANIIDEAKFWSVDEKLRAIGYAFLPVPTVQIAKNVLLAPIKEGSLVETPELAKWRSWYAQEVLRLEHAKQAPEPDKDGRISGEPRHVLNMFAAARDVLGLLWTDPHRSIDDKRIMSEWVWRCLRFESTPSLPWSNESVERRIDLMATVIVHAADLPLLAMFSGDDRPELVYGPYINWLTSSVLENRCIIDPVLENSFARQLSALLVPHLDDGQKKSEDEKSANAFMLSLYRRYLELFPIRWRELPIDMSDLSLPDPTVIAQYIRLPNPHREQLGTWLEELISALRIEFDPLTAAKRCCALPLELPEEFYADLNTAMCAEYGVSGPAHALVCLRALKNSDDNKEKCQTLMRSFTEGLNRHSKMMAAFLRKGAQQSARSQSWCRVHPVIAMALLCVWADCLALLMVAKNVDPDGAAEIIKGSEPSDLTCALHDSSVEPCFLDVLMRASETTIAGAMVSRLLQIVALDEVPGDVRERILGTIGHTGEDTWFPRLEIAFPRRSDPDGSWFGTDVVRAVVESASQPVAALFSERDCDRIVEVITSNELNSDHPFITVALLSVIDFSALSVNSVSAVAQHIDKVLRLYLDKLTDFEVTRAHAIKAEALGVLGDTNGMLAEIRSLASSMASRHGYGKAVDHSQKDLILLFEMTIAFVRRVTGSREDKAAMLARLVEAITLSWPKALHGSIKFLDRMIEMLPASAAIAIWPVLLRIRSVR
jgi:hypothetical protein